MKTGFFKGVALSGVAMLAFAQPASALTIGFEVVGTDLRIVASDLGDEIIAAWDFDIVFDNALTVADAFSDGQLGEVNEDTIFDWFDSAGLVDIFEVSFLSDAELADLQERRQPAARDDPLRPGPRGSGVRLRLGRLQRREVREQSRVLPGSGSHGAG